MEQFSAYIQGSRKQRNSLLRRLEAGYPHGSSGTKSASPTAKNGSRNSETHHPKKQTPSNLSERERLQKKLLADLYFSDHSDEERQNSSGHNSRPSDIVRTLVSSVNYDHHKATQLETEAPVIGGLRQEGGRATRLKPKIDYNENKRPEPMYPSRAHKRRLTSSTAQPIPTDGSNSLSVTIKHSGLSASTVPFSNSSNGHPSSIRNGKTERSRTGSSSSKTLEKDSHPDDNNGVIQESEDEDLIIDEEFLNDSKKHKFDLTNFKTDIDLQNKEFAQGNQTVFEPTVSSGPNSTAAVSSMDLSFIKTPSDLSVFQKVLVSEYASVSKNFTHSRIPRVDEMIKLIDSCVSDTLTKFNDFKSELETHRDRFGILLSKTKRFSPPPNTDRNASGESDLDNVNVSSTVKTPSEFITPLFSDFFDDLFKERFSSLNRMKTLTDYQLSLIDTEYDSNIEIANLQYSRALKENRESVIERLQNEIAALDREFASKNGAATNDDENNKASTNGESIQDDRKELALMMIKDKFANGNNLDGLTDLILEFSNSKNAEVDGQ